MPARQSPPNVADHTESLIERGMVLRSGRVMQCNQQTSFCTDQNKKGTQRTPVPESSACYLLDSIIDDQDNPASTPFKENILMLEWVSALEYRDIAWQIFLGSWGFDWHLSEEVAWLLSLVSPVGPTPLFVLYGVPSGRRQCLSHLEAPLRYYIRKPMTLARRLPKEFSVKEVPLASGSAGMPKRPHRRERSRRVRRYTRRLTFFKC